MRSSRVPFSSSIIIVTIVPIGYAVTGSVTDPYTLMRSCAHALIVFAIREKRKVSLGVVDCEILLDIPWVPNTRTPWPACQKRLTWSSAASAAFTGFARTGKGEYDQTDRRHPNHLPSTHEERNKLFVSRITLSRAAHTPPRCRTRTLSHSLTRRRLLRHRKRHESNGSVQVWVTDFIKLCDRAEPLRALSDPLNVNIDLVHCHRSVGNKYCSAHVHFVSKQSAIKFI